MAYENTPAVNKGGFVTDKEQHSTTHDQTSGLNQRNQAPASTIQNRPYSSPGFAASASDEDTSAKTESEGVTQGHHKPQDEKHGHGAGGSSTGLPEAERKES